MKNVTEEIMHRKCYYEGKAEAILKEFKDKRSRKYRLSLLARALEINYSEGREDGIWTAEVASDVKIDFVEPNEEEVEFMENVKAGARPFKLASTYGFCPVHGRKQYFIEGVCLECSMVNRKTPSLPQTHGPVASGVASPDGRQCPSATSENSGG